MKINHEHTFNFLGLTFEFYAPMLFLFSLYNVIDAKFSVQFSSEDQVEDYFIDIEFVLFNFELVGMYIDRYKTHFGFLGFGLNVWHRIQE